MSKIELLKGAVGFVSGLGVSQIISGIVANNTVQENAYQKATIFAGKIAIGMVVSEIVRKHTDAKIDAAVIWWKENVQIQIQEVQ